MTRFLKDKCQISRRFAAILGLSLLISACQTGSVDGLPAITSEDLSAVIDREIEKGEIPGGFALVANSDGHGISAARGVASLETGAPVREDTIFRFYSMTKPITCAAVLTLLDDQRIDLNDPISKYIPEFGSMEVLSNGKIVPSETPITIRHLMTHTSGLAYAVLPSPVQQYYAGANVFAIENRLSESLEDHIFRLSTMPLVGEPGSRWNYGESMGVLGRLVEVVSGQSFADYLKGRIFEPLGMRDTAFFVPAEKSYRLADLYHLSAEGIVTNVTGDARYGGSYKSEPMLAYGGAGLVGTPKDYLRFALMLLNNGELDGKRILSEEAVSAMTSNQLPEELGAEPLSIAGRGEGVGFGYCGLVTTASGHDGVPSPKGEYGWGGWASTEFWIDPGREITGLVFTQVIPDEIGSVGLSQSIRSLIYDAQSEARTAPTNK